MNPHRTLKSLFEATGVAVTPKMASCRVLLLLFANDMLIFANQEQDTVQVHNAVVY